MNAPAFLPSPRDLQILQLCRSGDPRAMEDVVRTHGDSLLRFALGMTADRALAEDLVQETFVRFITSLPRFEGRCLISTWLYSILRSALLEQKRRRAREADVHRQYAAQEAEPTSARAPETVDRILATLQRLDEDLRMPALLYYLERRSVEEIGEVLSLPKTTVKWRLHKARSVLKSLLPATGDAEARP